jgi:hypothetical protein
MGGAGGGGIRTGESDIYAAHAAIHCDRRLACGVFQYRLFTSTRKRVWRLASPCHPRSHSLTYSLTRPRTPSRTHAVTNSTCRLIPPTHSRPHPFPWQIIFEDRVVIVLGETGSRTACHVYSLCTQSFPPPIPHPPCPFHPSPPPPPALTDHT